MQEKLEAEIGRLKKTKLQEFQVTQVQAPEIISKGCETSQHKISAIEPYFKFKAKDSKKRGSQRIMMNRGSIVPKVDINLQIVADSTSTPAVSEF